MSAPKTCAAIGCTETERLACIEIVASGRMMSDTEVLRLRSLLCYEHGQVTVCSTGGCGRRARLEADGEPLCERCVGDLWWKALDSGTELRVDGRQVQLKKLVEEGG